VGPQATNSIDSTTAMTDRVNNQLFFMIENLLLAFSILYLAPARGAPRTDQDAVRITSFRLFPSACPPLLFIPQGRQLVKPYDLPFYGWCKVTFKGVNEWGNE
jgi:hypothetical protein